jgi:protein-tyrosine-phosphatase/predicted ATP-grasp superfamily ATP-dependent carboligase
MTLGLKVLVLGDDTRSFLAVVRSLGRQRCAVHAAPFDFSSPALGSRYIGAVHRLPPYSLSPAAWVEALRALIESERFDLVIPCDDRSLIPLERHAAELEGARLAVPNPEAMAVFFDKAETRALAATHGVPIAPGRLLAPDDYAAALAAQYGLPLALKPRSSYVLGQAGAKSSVRIVRSEDALADALTRVPEPTEWLVEGFFDGQGVGLSVLAEHGEVRLAFQHRRLAEASETGGSSSRISEAVDPRFRAAVEALARASALHGVAMFEFREQGPGGPFILLEVNARFWGSLPLAVAAGADFPAGLAAMLTGRAVAEERPYRHGLVQRDLGGEYYRVLVQSGALPPAKRLLRLASGLGGIALALPTGRAFDSRAADDPAPWSAERGQFLAAFGRALARRLPLLNGRRRRARRALARMAQAIGQGRGEIVMLCHGNICRSPFAGKLLEAKAAERGLSVSVISAGTIALEGRSSPPEAIAAARAFGADLAPHRSRYLDVDAARSAAAVIVFDEKNVDELRRLGLDGDVNLLRLGDLAGPSEIADPYGHGPAGFAQAYAEIDAAVERLAAALPGGR